MCINIKETQKKYEDNYMRFFIPKKQKVVYHYFFFSILPLVTTTEKERKPQNKLEVKFKKNKLLKY